VPPTKARVTDRENTVLVRVLDDKQISPPVAQQRYLRHSQASFAKRSLFEEGDGRERHDTLGLLAWTSRISMDTSMIQGEEMQIQQASQL
jgi:hypothetical protein